MEYCLFTRKVPFNKPVLFLQCTYFKHLPCYPENEDITVHIALPYACSDKLTLQQTHTLLIYELTQFILYFPSCQTNFKYFNCTYK